MPKKYISFVLAISGILVAGTGLISIISQLVNNAGLIFNIITNDSIDLVLIFAGLVMLISSLLIYEEIKTKYKQAFTVLQIIFIVVFILLIISALSLYSLELSYVTRFTSYGIGV